MSENEEFKNYLEDCLLELIERAVKHAKEASKERAKIKAKEISKSKTKKEFNECLSLGYNGGLLLGYYEVLDFLLHQAEVFDIKDKMTRLPKNFDPDKLYDSKFLKNFDPDKLYNLSSSGELMS